MMKDMPDHLALAFSYQGITEVSGVKANKEIVGFFKDAGHPEVTSDETAWCAAFVGACLERTKIVSTRSLLARSYLTWGKGTSSPTLGDIVVFYRGKKDGWEGHVAFFIKEDSKYVWVLGGNQANSVNISKYPKSTVLGYRTPSSLSTSRTTIGAGGAALGTAVSEVADKVKEAQDTLLGMPLDVAKWAAFAVVVISLALIVYARWDDIKKKGR